MLISIDIVECSQDEVQFPYGVIKRGSAPSWYPFSSLSTILSNLSILFISANLNYLLLGN